MTMTTDMNLEYLTEGSYNANESFNDDMDNIENGRTYKLTLGVNGTEGEVFYFDFATSKVKKAKADAAGTAHVVGFLTESGVTDEERFFRYVGKITKAGWGLTANSRYYLSEAVAGGITITKPVGANKIVEVGFTKADTNTLYIQVREYIEGVGTGQTLYDKTIDAGGDGDYTSWQVAAATEASDITFFVRNGTYVESLGDIVIKDGQNFIGESAEGVIIDFNGVGKIFPDISGAIVEAGTVTLTNASTTITGNGTAWTSALNNHWIVIEGEIYRIDSVSDGTHLTIIETYRGKTRAGLNYFAGDMADNIVIKNVTMKNNTDTPGYNMYWSRAIRSYIENVIFQENSINCTALYLAHSAQCTFRNLLIKDIHGVGINLVNMSAQNLFDNVIIQHSVIGLWNGGYYNTFRSCRAIGCSTEGIYDFEGKGNVYENCHAIGTNQDGIKVVDSENITFDSCTAIQNGFNGFSIATSDYCKIANCDSSFNTKHGIYTNTVKHSIITENEVEGNDSADSATYDGIHIDASSEKNIIAGNRCKDNDRYELNLIGSNNIYYGNHLEGTDHVAELSDTGTNRAIFPNEEAVVNANGYGKYKTMSDAATGESAGAIITVSRDTITEIADFIPKEGQVFIGLGGIEGDDQTCVRVDMGDFLIDINVSEVLMSGIYFYFAPTTDEVKIDLDTNANYCRFRSLTFDFTGTANAHKGIADFGTNNCWRDIAIIGNANTYTPLHIKNDDSSYECFKMIGGKATVDYIILEDAGNNYLNKFNVSTIASGSNLEYLIYEVWVGASPIRNVYSNIYLDGTNKTEEGMYLSNIGSIVDKIYITNVRRGITVDVGDGIKITNFTIETLSSYGIIVNNSATGFVIDQGLIDGVPVGISLAGADYSTFSNIRIKNAASGNITLDSTSTQNSFVGINGTGTLTVAGDDNKFTNCTFATISLSAAAQRNVFVNCDWATLTDASGLHNTFGTLVNLKNSAPTVNDDIGDNMRTGITFWFDTVTKYFYICADETSTAAVWSQIFHNGADFNANGKNITNLGYITGNSTFVRIGSAGASGHGLTADNDLLIAGKLEVDGLVFFDSNVDFGGNYLQNTSRVYVGNTYYLDASGDHIRMTFGTFCKTVDTSFFYISGGNAYNSGARFQLYGGTHATLANTMNITATAGVFMGGNTIITGTYKLGINELTPIAQVHLTRTAVNPAGHDANSSIIIEHNGTSFFTFIGNSANTYHGLSWGHETDSFIGAFWYDFSINQMNWYVNNATKMSLNSTKLNLSAYIDLNGNYITNLGYITGNSTYIRIGSAGASGHGLTADNDLLIAGKLEVDGNAHFDSQALFYAGIWMGDNDLAIFGDGNDSGIMWGTAQTNHACIFGIDATSRSLLLVEIADRLFDFAHTAQPNPTFFIHSANQSTTEWISFTHNQTDGEYDVGLGGHIFSSAGAQKFKITTIGGLAIKLTNKTGAVTVAGQLVKPDTANNDAVILTAADDLEVIGIFLDSGIADGAEAWVVVSGIGDVALEDNTGATRGNWARTSITEAGYADATNASAPQPINQTHFAEIGHCVESVAAGGAGTHVLARCVLHFN